MKTVNKLAENVVMAYETDGYVNRPLSKPEIIKMLAMHGYRDNDTVNEALENVSNLFEMLAFLGY